MPATVSQTSVTFNKTLRKPGIAEPQDIHRTHLSFDLETGAVISQKNANDPVHPASLSKLMLLAIVFDKISDRSLRLDDVVKISNRAKKIHPPRTNLENITVAEAIRLTLVTSLNDIATALAEHIGRTEWRFCHEYMNTKAAEIGMASTEFWSVTGLPSRNLPRTKPLPESVTTAVDLAKLVTYLLDNYPHILQYSAEKHAQIDERFLRNTNPLVKQDKADGLKTGTLQCAGYHLVATSEELGHRIVVISLGNYYEEQRTSHALDLLIEGHQAMQLGTPAGKPELQIETT